MAAACPSPWPSHATDNSSFLRAEPPTAPRCHAPTGRLATLSLSGPRFLQHSSEPGSVPRPPTRGPRRRASGARARAAQPAAAHPLRAQQDPPALRWAASKPPLAILAFICSQHVLQPLDERHVRRDREQQRRASCAQRERRQRGRVGALGQLDDARKARDGVVALARLSVANRALRRKFCCSFFACATFWALLAVSLPTCRRRAAGGGRGGLAVLRAFMATAVRARTDQGPPRGRGGLASLRAFMATAVRARTEPPDGLAG